MSHITRNLLIGLFCLPIQAFAYQSNVSINGQILSQEELTTLQQQVGPITPGNYLYDAQSQCWANLSNGTQGCLGNGSQSYFSRYGSGERSSDGSWSNYSNAAGMGVGGTPDGCLYTTTGWSNC